MKPEVNYTYNAEVISVYDGDTIRVNIDLGFGIQNFGEAGKGLSLRLYGIDAPEVRGSQKESGKETRDFLRSLILGKKVTLQTIKDTKGKYGRYLAIIYIDELQTSVNDYLVQLGLAINKNY